MNLIRILSALLAAAATVQAHLHIQARYEAGQWSLFLLDFEAGEFPSDAFPLVVSAAACTVAPKDARYVSILGQSGSDIWIVPEREKRGVLNLGVGSEAPSPSAFSGNRMAIVLREARGPGEFAAYGTDPLGGPIVYFNTRDGIGQGDRLSLPASSSHLHLNWAFSAPGDYELTFEAEGTLSASQQLVRSMPATFRFTVHAPVRPVFSLPVPKDNRFSFQVLAPAFWSCRIEGSSDLQTWNVLTNFTAGAEPSWHEFSIAGRQVHFMRAVTLFE